MRLWQPHDAAIDHIQPRKGMGQRNGFGQCLFRIARVILRLYVRMQNKRTGWTRVVIYALLGLLRIVVIYQVSPSYSEIG